MVYQSCFQAMGTRFQLLLPEIDQQFGEYLQTIIVRKVETLEQALSLFREDSAITQLNQALLVSKCVQIDNVDLWHALTLAALGKELTDGYYNAACGEITQAIKHGIQTTDTDFTFTLNSSQEVEVNRVGIQFDFGGLGKGMALDAVKYILANEGIKKALVSFGESSILGVGSHPHGESWPISVPDPLGGEESLIEVNLQDNGLTLSSTISNGANHGQLQHHLIDPKTGKVVDKARTSLVESTSMAWGEMLSTASVVADKSFASISVPEANVKNIIIFRHEKGDYEI